MSEGEQSAGFIGPCLPSPTKAAPTGTDWLHEIKHDGFRILARKVDNRTILSDLS